MHEQMQIVTDLALILISASVITLICRLLKQPVILGYIIAGFLVGPHFEIFPNVANKIEVELWSELGVIFLLFGLGLEFSFKKLVKVGSTSLITAGSIFIGMFVTGIFVGHALGWTSMESLFLAAMLSMSSTTIIIKAFDDLGLKHKAFTAVVFGTLIVEDILAILVMVLLSTFALTQQFSGTEMLISLLKLGFFLILWFLIGIFVIPTLLKSAKKILNSELLLILSIGLCFGMVALAEYADFSPALGAFMMGSILAETIEGERISKTIKGVKDLFGAIFFVSIGMMLDPSVILVYWKPILLLLFVVLFFIPLFMTIGCLLAGKTIRISIRAALSMAQIGEFAFIIAALGLRLNEIGEQIFPIIIVVSVITTFTTPYLIKLADPLADKLYSILPAGLIEKLDERYSHKEKEVEQKSAWKILFQRYFGRIILYSVPLFAILFLNINYLGDFLQKELAFLSPVYIKWLDVTITVLLMSPFIYGMIINKGKCHDSFQALWEKNINRAPLIALTVLRSLLAIFFIAIVFFQQFEFSYWLLLLLSFSLLLVFLITRNTVGKLAYVEKMFFENLNQIELHENERAPMRTSIKSKLAGKNLHTEVIIVSPYSSYIGKRILEIPFRKEFGINIVKITRANLAINIPSPNEQIFPYDRLLVVGTDEQIETFSAVMASDAQQESIPDEPVEVNSYILSRQSFLVGKALLNTKLRDDGCMILGVERGEDSIMNPSPDFVFEVSDIVWMVGDKAKCEWYI